MSARAADTAGGDEADEIRDPNLRRIFRVHRKVAGETNYS